MWVQKFSSFEWRYRAEGEWFWPKGWGNQQMSSTGVRGMGPPPPSLPVNSDVWAQRSWQGHTQVRSVNTCAVMKGVGLHDGKSWAEVHRVSVPLKMKFYRVVSMRDHLLSILVITPASLSCYFKYVHSTLKTNSNCRLRLDRELHA